MFNPRNSDELVRDNRSASDPSKKQPPPYVLLGDSEESLDLSQFSSAVTPNISHDSDLVTDLDRDSHDNMLINSYSRRGSAPEPVNREAQNYLHSSNILYHSPPGQSSVDTYNSTASVRDSTISATSSRAMSTGYLYIPTPDTNVEFFMDKQVEDHEMGIFFLNMLWVVVACGYMIAWTSIGSLIVYFKAQYGAFFYVRLYCAFYLPGLPVSWLQRKYDDSFDQKFGSANAFLIRVAVGMVTQLVVLMAFPYIPVFLSGDDIPNTIIVFMGIIGVACWICHGTASQLCGMFPPSSVAFLQTGFCAPQIFTIIMVFVLDLDDEEAKTNHVDDMYRATAAIVFLGTVSWFALARSTVALQCFALKDGKPLPVKRPSFNIRFDRNSGAFQIKKRRRSFFRGKEEETTVVTLPSTLKSPLLYITEEDDDVDKSTKAISKSSSSNSLILLPPDEENHRSVSTNSKTSRRGGEDLDDGDEALESGKSEKSGGGGDGVMIQKSEEEKRLSGVVETEQEVNKLISFCRVSIFLNIWCSIFAAAFFVYVPSSHKPLMGALGGPTLESVEVILYFVRLFSDLLGRPLAGTYRPNFLASKQSLVFIAGFRIVLMFVFFWYTALAPMSLHSDFFIIVVVAVFSVFSGYLSVLSYEYAAQEPKTKAGSALACSLMNSTFQVACFTAVVASVAVSEAFGN